jgi:hypothetical protein
MDANAKLDRVVIGLRSGLIVMFNLVYDQDLIVNVDEVELGVSNCYLKHFSFIQAQYWLLKYLKTVYMEYLVG